MYTVQTNATWQICSANSTLAFEVVGSGAIEIGLSGASAPPRGFTYSANQGDRGSLTDLFPTSTGANVWVRSSFPSEVCLG
jgi:hypothetical protein